MEERDGGNEWRGMEKSEQRQRKEKIRGREERERHEKANWRRMEERNGENESIERRDVIVEAKTEEREEEKGRNGELAGTGRKTRRK